MSKKYDVLGIGNALVDVLTREQESFLAAHQIEKGGMTLIDTERATSLYEMMSAGTEVSGGSAANTIAGVASLGAKAAFIGKVANDQLGTIFAHDMRSIGVSFETPMGDGAAFPTGRCLIIVTPDAQRSMSTYLGMSTQLCTDDLNQADIQDASINYLEGYLFDPPAAREAFYAAAGMAHAAGSKIALTLSDSFCVERYRSEFQHLVENEVDLLFANEAEIKSLYQVDAFDDALQIVRQKCETAALTRSEAGSVIVRGDEVHVIEAAHVDEVVDSTGAGDMYAAGFMAGLAMSKDLKTCGQLASMAAAEVISHIGPKPETPLIELAEAKGLI